MKSALLRVQVIQISDEPLNAAVRRRIFERPFHGAAFPKFVARSEFAAHEEQLFAGMREHVAEEQTQVGEFLPVVARHFGEQRVFAVDHFIVRKRQNEILAEGVQQRKGQVVVVELAMDGIGAK